MKPLKRAGNRRYYRPADVAVARRIQQLLDEKGYTIKGAQKALREGGRPEPEIAPRAAPDPLATPAIPLEKLRGLRDRLQAALDA